MSFWAAASAFNAARISSQLDDIQRDAYTEADRKYDELVKLIIEALCNLQIQFDLEPFIASFGEQKLELPNEADNSCGSEIATQMELLSSFVANVTGEDWSHVLHRITVLYFITHSVELTSRCENTDQICDRLKILYELRELQSKLIEIRDNEETEYPLSVEALDEICVQAPDGNTIMGSALPPFTSRESLNTFINVFLFFDPCSSPGSVEEREKALWRPADIFGDAFRRYSTSDGDKTKESIKEIASRMFIINSPTDIDKFFFPQEYDSRVFAASIAAAIAKGILRGRLTDYMVGAKRSTVPGKLTVFKNGKRFAVIDLVED